MNRASLDGKVVIVTGGAGLLGREFGAAVAEAGGCAVLADIDARAAKRAAAALSGRYGRERARWARLDIGSKSSVRALLRDVRSEHGRIDAVVNNAYPRNRRYGRRFEKVEYRDFCENVSLNLGGYFLVGQQAALFFKKQGFGHIVNIASIYGVIAPRFEIYAGTGMTLPVEYAAIKSGLLHLTRYTAKYLRGTGIRCNAISPGGIFDGQDPGFVRKYKAHCLSKGMLDKSDLKGTLVYLLSDLSSFVNGQNIVVDDGFTL